MKPSRQSIPSTPAAIAAERVRLTSRLDILAKREAQLKNKDQINVIIADCLTEVGKITGQTHTISDLVKMKGARTTRASVRVAGSRTKRLTPEQLAALDIELIQRQSDIAANKTVEPKRKIAERYDVSTQTINTHQLRVRAMLAEQAKATKDATKAVEQLANTAPAAPVAEPVLVAEAAVL